MLVNKGSDDLPGQQMVTLHHYRANWLMSVMRRRTYNYWIGSCLESAAWNGDCVLWRLMLGFRWWVNHYHYNARQTTWFSCMNYWMWLDWVNFLGWTRKYINGLVQERCNSSALAMELRLSCINPQTCRHKDRIQGVGSIQGCHPTSIGNPTAEIRRSYDRLIFIMEIPIPGKTIFILKRVPGSYLFLRGVAEPSVVKPERRLGCTFFSCLMGVIMLWDEAWRRLDRPAEKWIYEYAMLPCQPGTTTCILGLDST